ncbi:MAG: glycoside hydrolase family 2 TIM barrel-domain containing protein [Lachnospiraceae bacterium]
MKETLFNTGWRFQKMSGNFLAVSAGKAPAVSLPVTLPHDAMAYEATTKETKNGSAVGFYPGGNYVYEKEFDLPQKRDAFHTVFLFEAVYGRTTVYINGEYAGEHAYGYTPFCIDADNYLHYGGKNKIRVVVKNGMEPNARWYSGAGLYRDVWMLTSSGIFIPPYGLRVTTENADPEAAVIRVELAAENLLPERKKIQIRIEITDDRGQPAASEKLPLTLFAGGREEVSQRIFLEDAALWSPENPALYHCRAILEAKDGTPLDESTCTFGIRTLALDAKRGLRINGKETKLRGACIHHDNGVIGALSLPDAEDRRIQKLKEAGFNAIRSAHNPAGRALLDACDRYGILVMDELCDGWHEAKSDYDYTMDYERCWRQDLSEMIRRDYNHPSVIIYSLGNEIQEAGTGQGARQFRKMAEAARALDHTRYLTAGLNSFFVISDVIPQLMGELMQAAAKGGKLPQSDPSMTQAELGYAVLKGPAADFLCSHPTTSRRMEEIYSAMDICGMNYMTGRFASDHLQYPNRVILSTENFPSDIAKTWGIVLENPHVIGDMTWTGWDYLGEAGIGAFYYDGHTYIDGCYPDRLAYCGDLDILGNRRPLSFLREIVYGHRKEPYIAVQKVDHIGTHGISTPWALSDTLHSWTWKGLEGTPAKVEVYSPSEEVELLLNGTSLGRKPCGRATSCRAVFEVPYAPGTLEAVGYTKGQEDGRDRLVTAGDKVHLALTPEKTVLCANGRDLCYIDIALEDENGNLNCQQNTQIQISVTGAGTLEGFGGADPRPSYSYKGREVPIFEGRALAVIRSSLKPGAVQVTFTCRGEEMSLTLEVVEDEAFESTVEQEVTEENHG